MSNQIVITSGAKLRDLDDVIIGTDGILSSVAFNVANGVPRLDENGKILVSQLPNSVMEFKGVWNAATNTPYLTNGVGNAGDVWLCNEAGTVDFGDGPIYFAVGDYAVYTGTEWARSSGATGTVTSVGVSRDGNALSITGSPITTSGTINLGFSGDNTQYINGAGNLTTFPTLITSIGLTMPAAFGVSNSPLTANGTIGVTALGYPSQYIRGDGTLADFPTSGGGGSSVSYYLNGGTSQGSIGGTTYYEMSKTADTGTGVDFSKTGDGLICAFLTDANDPALLQIPAGNWNYEIYASMSSNGGTPEMYAELYVYNGSTFTLISTSSHEILYDGVNLNLYSFACPVPQTTLTVTDRLAIKLYATNSGGKTTTIHTQDSHLCQVITTFTTGLTALNGLTAQVQYFGTGTSGSDFNIVSSVDTHTFNLPTASATKRGALSSADWSTFNGKQDQLNGTGFIKATGTTIYYDNNTYALDADVVHLTGNETIGGTKTFSNATKNNGGILLQNGSSYSLSGYMNLGGMTNGLRFTSGLGISNYFALPSSTGYTYTFPSATGTVALTSDISYPVTSVFGRTGAVVAVSGDYTTSQVTEGTNLYFTNARARTAISLTTTGSTGAATYNNTTGVLNIPNYADQYVGTVTSVGLSAPTGFSVSGSPVTSSGTLALSFASGYSLPTNVKQSNWDDAYTWVAAFPTQTGNNGKFLTTDGSSLSWAANPLGTVTSVAMSVPTGLTVSGSPITTSGTLAVTLTAGYSIPTTANQSTWSTAYNRSLTSAAVTGTTTKTLTLNQQDGGTITASWTDYDTAPVTSVFGRTGAVVATEGDYTLTQLGDVTITTPSSGQVLKYNGTAWINDTDANTGTVTSVAMTVPTGLSITGSPITSSGTLAVTFAAGYSIPTNASQTNWDTAYTNRIISLTVTGSSGAATLLSNVLNIPTYTLSGLGGVPTTRTLTINGVGYDLSADRTWTITAGVSGSGTQNKVAKWNNAGGTTIGDSIIESTTIVDITSSGAALGTDSIYYVGRYLQDKTTYRGIAIGYQSTAQRGIIYAESAGASSSLGFATYDGTTWAQRVYITSWGMGILGTSSTAYNFVIQNSNSLTGLYATDGGGLTKDFLLSTGGSSGAGAIKIFANGNTQIAANNLADQSYKLYVGGTGYYSGALFVGDGGNTTVPCIKISSTTTGISSATSEQLNFITNSITRHTIGSTGQSTFTSSVSGAIGTFNTTYDDYGALYMKIDSATSTSRNWGFFWNYGSYGEFRIAPSSTSTGNPDATIPALKITAVNATFSNIVYFANGIVQSNASNGIYSNVFGPNNGGAQALSFIYNANGNVIYNNGTDRLILTSGGKVNINNSTNTDFQLYVDAGNITSGTSKSIAAFRTGTSIYFDIIQSYDASPAGQSLLGTLLKSTDDLAISTLGVERFRIDTGGDIRFWGSATTVASRAVFRNSSSALTFFAGDSGSSTKEIQWYVTNGTTQFLAMQLRTTGYLYLPKARIIGDTDIAYMDLYNPNVGNIRIVNTSASTSFGNVEIYTNNTVRFTFNTNGYLTFKGTSTGLYSTSMYNDNSSFGLYATDGGGTTKEIMLSTGGSNNAPALRMFANGNNQFANNNTSDQGYKLYVGGAIYASSDVTAYSDISVKENIRPIENVLTRINNSRGVLYDRIDTKTKNNIGFIAQELEKEFPELITTNLDGTKGVKYQNAVAVLFEAIKEQQKQINELKNIN